MAASFKDYFRIDNKTVPTAHKPQFCGGVIDAQGDGETNLLGERTGARGGYTCRLWWEVMSIETYQWWMNESGIFPADMLSVPVSDLILPDMLGLGIPVANRQYHGLFYYGVISKPIVPPNIERRWLGSGAGRKPHFIGTIEILITQINENPPL